MGDDNYLHWGVAKFYPLIYQSRNIAFEDWITLLTLCLAPLIAHIVSGAPRPSYISKSKPRWHDRLCHFNPTSILFRYAAVTDRRIRARKWDTSTMAAANALFWTDQGWDGSEEMASRSPAYCAYLPEHPRVELVSWEMGKTIIITLQGAEPLYCLITILTGGTSKNPDMALDAIFPSIALMGLLRLCAALWLTDDFVYTMNYDGQTRSTAVQQMNTANIERVTPRKASFDSLLQPDLAMEAEAGMQFRPLSYWPSRVFRIFYFVAIFSLAALCSTFLVPSSQNTMYTTTSLLVGMLNLTYLAVSILLYGYYSFRGTTSTIIPCISSMWYKIYTLFILTFMVGLIVISAIETRDTPCGKFTSLPGETGDVATCSRSPTQLLPVHQSSDRWFGLISSSRVDGHYQILAQNFTGSCIGILEGQTYSATIVWN